MHVNVIILGAGASGLVCARQCALRGRTTLVLDHAPKPGCKVRVSGGGRCNVTNRQVFADHYLCATPHFVKSALSQYPPERILEFMAEHGLSVIEEDHGRLFCVQGAKSLVDALFSSALQSGARFRFNESITAVRVQNETFVVDTSCASHSSDSLVMATGGPAWPQIKATDIGHRLARSLDVTVTPVTPGLVPLKASPEQAQFCRSLTGVSLPVCIAVNTVRIHDALLFTHHGISGPAVLDASLYWQPGRHLLIDFCPDRDIAQTIADHGKRKTTRNALARLLPSRLSAMLCELHGWTGQAGVLPAKTLTAMERLLHAYPFHPSGLESLNKAEVTKGGVDTDQISSKTMEAKARRGLFFSGEVLDVTGRLGGYNLQWAWSSGFVAGQWA